MAVCLAEASGIRKGIRSEVGTATTSMASISTAADRLSISTERTKRDKFLLRIRIPLDTFQ